MPKISKLSSASGTTTVESHHSLIVNVGSTTMKAKVNQVMAGVVSQKGDLIYAESSVEVDAIPVGSSGTILQSSGDVPVWVSLENIFNIPSIGFGTTSPAYKVEIVPDLAIHDAALTPTTNKAPLYIWNNPTTISDGEVGGLFINISNNEVATPGAGDLEGALIRVTNDSMSSASLWGLELIVQQGVTPSTDTFSRGMEISLHGAATSATLQFDPFGGTGQRINGIEIVGHEGSTYYNTAGLTVWANDSTGNKWWYTGIALSRVADVGILFTKLAADSTDPFQTAVMSVKDLTLDPLPFVLGKDTGHTHLRFTNNADATMGLEIDSGNTTAHVSYVTYADRGTVKWWMGKDSTNVFVLYDVANTAPRIIVSSGVQIGTPTGGDQGAGTLNVQGDIYKNSSAYTNPDYVLEQWATGKTKETYIRPSLAEVKEHITLNHRLLGISDEPSGIFARSNFVLEKIEELFTYVIELDDRLEEIEHEHD